MRVYFIIAVLAMPLFFSCVNTRKATYFANLPDSTTFNEVTVPEYTIQKNDLLSITVSSVDPEASETFNRPNQSQVRSSTPTGDVIEPAGYLVNSDGFIRFLMLGLVKAEGLSKEQLSINIRKAIEDKKLLVDPIVEVRHLNFKVTVLGEVNRPTVITVPNEKVTLLEAVGLAGDMTIFAKRTNVLLIRTEAGKRITNRIDMSDSTFFNSPYYYLKQNDVVYVEPNKARVLSASRLNLFLPAIVSSLYILVVVIDRLTR
jgi:polysaccharide export outer membrane protein